jgi:hypothetical protein
MTLEQIARVAHEVNRAYCQALGDQSQPAWEDAAGVAGHITTGQPGRNSQHMSRTMKEEYKHEMDSEPPR